MPSEEERIDKRAYNGLMYGLVLGKTDRPTAEPLDSRPQGQVVSLNLLGVPLSDQMLLSRDFIRISKVIV